MLVKWLQRLVGRKSRGSPPRPRRPPRVRTRLFVEALEARDVPAAIRNLPGLMANALPPEDDAPSMQANLGFTINFFGFVDTTCFVNNNGNITFQQALSQFTPTALNTNNGGIPIIAPFFADVDTRQGMVVHYGTDTLCGYQVFGVDWIQVGYFAQHVDKLNSFQLLLISRPDTGAGNFDIEFNYDTIRWETGDASGGQNGLGGNSARVGYSNGSGVPGTFAELPGSGINGAFLDGGPMALAMHDMLASTPGRYHFLVRAGQVETMAAATSSTMAVDITNSLRVFYPRRYVHRRLLGGIDTGKLTLWRLGSAFNEVVMSSMADCLDEMSTSTTMTTTNPFGPPITLVFRLPPGVSLVNRSGITASGLYYLTLPNATLPNVGHILRQRLIFRNPGHASLSSFYQGFGVQVFAGPFDATMF